MMSSAVCVCGSVASEVTGEGQSLEAAPLFPAREAVSPGLGL